MPMSTGLGPPSTAPSPADSSPTTSLLEANRHPLAGARDTASEAYRRYLEMASALRFLIREGQQTLAQAALRFILMHQGVTVILGGFSALEHLEEIVPVSGAGPLAPELMARVEMVWRANFGLAGPPPPVGGG